MKRRYRFSLLMICILFVINSVSISANAVEPLHNNRLLQNLYQHSTGSSIEEITEAAILFSRSNSIPLDVALARAWKQELRNSKPALLRGSPHDAYITLDPAFHKGDVFYTPAATFTVEHGHTGIYSSKTRIVEAGQPFGVREVSYDQVKVAPGAVKLYLKMNQATRDKAADRSRKYIKRSYNTVFFFNKTENGNSMNCSQLVWASFKYGAGVDIAPSINTGVYPTDILNSKFLEVYQRYIG